MMDDEYPTLVSGLLAVGAATGGTAVLGETLALRQSVGIVGAGAVLLVAGIAVLRSRSRAIGTPLALVGLAVSATGGYLGYTTSEEILHVAIVAPGALGILFVALGVAPLRGSGSRRFTKIACWLVFIGPIASAGMKYGDLWQILAATVAAALVWDLGENSVSLGRHVGRRARSFGAEAVHSFGSLLVGVISAGGAYAAYGYGTGGKPLEVVVVLLVAVVLLIGFLHN